VCLIGDGGLQFSLQELAAAVEARIPIMIIVWNNQSYGEIKSFMAERNIPQIGVDIHTPDFLTLAEAMGCKGVRPNSIDQLKSLISEAGARDIPTIIEIRSQSPLAHELAGAVLTVTEQLK
jgi:acetolactate synthase-1/2/3 large subunit